MKTAMKSENLEALERLSFFCHICGLITIFLGFIVICLNVMGQRLQDIQVGIFIIAVGYSFTKISSRLQGIVYDEKKNF